MNLKQSILSSAAISTVTIAVIASPGYSNPSQAFEANSVAATATAQVLPENMLEGTLEDLYARTGKATYKLKNPAIQFDYNPNFFVLESFETTSETASEMEAPLVDLIRLWNKKDFLILENAGDEIGDFPPKLRLLVYENPEGLPLQDWIVTQRDLAAVTEIENVIKSDITVAGQEAWTFSYTSLFRYDNIAFKDAEGRVIVLSLGLPIRNTSNRSETIGVDEDYITALSVMIESIELTTAESE